MLWNWQHPTWPRFSWDDARLAQAEDRFLINSGVFLGGLSHVSADEQQHVRVEALTGEAMATSAIESEILNRANVQSSVRQQLGLAADIRRVEPREQGIAAMMVDLYHRAATPLTEDALFVWHRMVCNGRRDLRMIGGYRNHPQPILVVSGRLDEPIIHFEAPPSATVSDEMHRFMTWFADTAPGQSRSLPALTRAGIAHLYFESIHPFEDGNGRVGRAVAEHALTQHLGRPTLTVIAETIFRHRKDYYAELQLVNKSLDITPWLAWFAGVVLEAQVRSSAQIQFIINKTRLLSSMRDQLKDRQMCVLLRIFAEGLDGFIGGLSAANYTAIAKTPPATTTRDLGDMVAKGALTRTGENKGVRYHLPFSLPQVPSIVIRESGEIVEV